MPIHIHTLVDADMLHEMIEGRFIKRVVHPDGSRLLYNYTERAQYQRVWNSATLTCRGLITDHAGIVIARPWAKFFNYTELDGFPEGAVEVTDKLDGSLGVMYQTTDSGLAIATRGSFTSEQAVHATQCLRDRYADFTPRDDVTYLFEIIYPENRVVVDYGQFDDLVLLGGVETSSGRSIRALELCNEWHGPVVEHFAHRSLEEAIAAPSRDGREGLVVHHINTGERVKIKQSEYVRLHRLVTGLSTKTIWEHLRDGADLDELLGVVPDEFYGWVRAVVGALEGAWRAELEFVEGLYATLRNRIVETGDVRVDRGMFAAQVAEVEHRWRPVLFLMYDGKDPAGALWEMVRPEHSRAYKIENGH